jgi:hypothetical protein
MTVSKVVGAGLLPISFLALALIARPLAAEKCFAKCPACAKHLGGTGVAGPYPDKETCKTAVAKMIQEGFPFEACDCDAASSGSPEARADSSGGFALHPGTAAVVGFVGGGLAGSFFGGTTTNDAKNATITAENIGGGAVIGAVVMFGIAKLAAEPTNFAPLFTKIAYRLDFAPATYSPVQGRQRHGFLLQIRWTLR